MSTQIPTVIDQELADRLSAEFHRCFTDFEASDGLFAPNTFFDLLPPMWRFQFEGPGEVFTSQLRSIAHGPSEIEIVRTVPTTSGFVTEHIESQHTPDGRDHGTSDPPLRGTRRPHLPGHDLLQRRMGRRAACASRR